jgi:hypothetical protein
MASSEKAETFGFILFRESTKENKIFDFFLSGVAQEIPYLMEV